MIVKDSKGREVQLTIGGYDSMHIEIQDARYVDPHVQAAGDDPEFELPYIKKQYERELYNEWMQIQYDRIENLTEMKAQ